MSNAAVWWPQRQDIPTDAEQQYSLHNLTDGGLEIYTALHGPSTSSARPELLAVILALLAPRAAHLGVDNLAVVRTANKMIQRINSPHTLPKPTFNIMTDGDLWKIFWQVVEQKGSHSIKITK
eukprot:9731113-Karenia_brevis.AAC.1